MIKEKIFSVASTNTSTFGEIETRRYTKQEKSPKELFNPKTREANPLEVGYGRTKEILGL